MAFLKTDFIYRYQIFFGLLAGAFMLSATLLLIAHTCILNERTVYAASTDIKGSPNVAIAAIPVKSAISYGKMDIKIAYSDGHVSDPPSGTLTFDPPPVATTGGMVTINNPPPGMTYMYALGSDRQLYTLEGGGWAAAGALLP